MAKFQIKAPDGATYEVEAPDGASKQEILDYVKANSMPDVSPAESAGRGALQGVTFGFSDEIYGAAKGAVDKVAGSGNFSGTYVKERDAVRAANARAQEANPGTYLVGELAGGVALPFGAARLGAQGARTAVNAGLRARTIAAAREGGIYGAAYGLGKGEGSVADQALSTAGGAVGGAATGALLNGAFETARGIRSAYARSGQTGAYDKFSGKLGNTTIEQFADDIATGASRQNQPINRLTFDILGEEMVRHGDDSQAAAQATIQRLVSEHNLSPGAATARLRRLTTIHRDSPLTLGEYPAVAESNRATRFVQPQNADLAEASQITHKGTQDLIDYLGNSGSGRAVDATRNAVEDRQAGLQDWFRGRLQEMAPGGRTLDDAEQMIDGLRRQARQEYDAVYNAPGGENVNYRILHGLMPRVVERHLNRMRGRGGEQADALRHAINELYVDTPDGHRLIMPSLQIAQDMRGAIRGMIETADRAGRTHVVQTLQPLYRDITRVMERSSPTWAQANRRWAGMRNLDDALEFGQRLSSRASVVQRQAFREFEAMAPQAQDLVRVGWLQQQFDRLGELRDTHDVSKLFDRQNMYATVERLFGRQSAVTFARNVRDAEVANRSMRMLGNSATHRRGMMQKEMDVETGVISAAENASIKGARAWLVEKLANVVRDRRNLPLSRIVTTPMRDMAQVAGHVRRMRNVQDRLRNLQQRPHVAPYGGGISSALGAYYPGGSER